MKLILCPACSDIKKIGEVKTFCECKKSFGFYLPDNLNAIIGGKAIPLGISNPSLADSIRNRPNSGMGSRFDAWTIPYNCDTIINLNNRSKKNKGVVTIFKENKGGLILDQNNLTVSFDLNSNFSKKIKKGMNVSFKCFHFETKYENYFYAYDIKEIK